jgi:hypothetical protein
MIKRNKDGETIIFDKYKRLVFPPGTSFLRARCMAADYLVGKGWFPMNFRATFHSPENYFQPPVAVYVPFHRIGHVDRLNLIEQ